jgi:type VI secretion system protein VasJ
MKTWQWVICGKHPALKDYFQLGPNLPMVTALAEWVEKGYRGVARAKTSPADLLAWRFWMGGMDRNTLLCGILRDSTDSVGRPYPLLVVGSGSLTDWGTQWDLVPQACEQSWSQMESLSARIFRNLKGLEDDLARVRAPQPAWAEFSELPTQAGPYHPSSSEPLGPERQGNIEGQVIALAKESEILVALDAAPSVDPFTLIRVWHTSLKKHHPEPPKAVFMGGNTTATRLAFLRRPLTTQDFIRLWSA